MKIREQRYSSSQEPPNWLPVGNFNQYKLIVRDCPHGTAGTVMYSRYVNGQQVTTTIGTGKVVHTGISSTQLGGDPLYIHTVEWEAK